MGIMIFKTEKTVSDPKTNKCCKETPLLSAAQNLRI